MTLDVTTYCGSSEKENLKSEVLPCFNLQMHTLK